MATLQNNKDELALAYAKIISCDKANEIMELHKQGKRSSRYDDQVFDYLDKNGEGKFYLSSMIDRYEQTEETKAEKRNSEPYFVMYLDELPVCLIRSEINEEPDQKWDYYDYPLNDKRCIDIIRTGKFYILNASNYGLYLIGENDYYPISGSPFEEENFFAQVKKLNISFDDKKIEKTELKLDQTKNLGVTIKDYDYSINESDLSNIRNFIKENKEDYDDCYLIGPIPMYQYGFTSLDNVEVYDTDRENGSLCFKLVRDDKVVGYIHYDPYDDGADSQIESETNEADKTEKDIHSYYVSLSPVGYVFADRIVEKEEDDPSCSLISKKVAEKIQTKIREDKPEFKVYK